MSNANTLDIEALYSVLHIHLIGLCGGRVFPLVAPAQTTAPFVIYGFEGGGEANRRRSQTSTLTLVVKCVADRLEDAFLNARLIGNLLRNQGDQDNGSNPLPAHADWRITTSTQGLLVHLYEEWKDGRVFYHCGHQYEFTMEPRP